MKYLKPIFILALSMLLISSAFAGSDEFLKKVNYRGAFGATNWAAGWSAMSEYGFFALGTAEPTEIVTVTDADIAPGETVHWTADKVWLLDGRVFVDDGAVLIIEAGTVIKGKPGQKENASALIVARGGKIFAEGTPVKPIIFTSENDDLANPTVPPASAKGLWGGLIILGKAQINHPNGETNIEGIPTTDPRGMYGGTDDEDCSGVLRYVSIRHGGTEIGEGNEINGLTMGGVGRGTTISHIEVFANKDDGFEWFGGTVNCDHLVAAFCGDDAFDIDEGLRNKLQFLFAIQEDSTGDHCAEHDGAPESSVATATPLSHTVVYNATYLGGGMSGDNGSRMLRLREKFGGAYMNSIFGDYNGYGLRVDDDQTPHDASDRMAAGELTVGNNIWFNFSAGNDVNALGDGKAHVVDHLAANNNDIVDPMLNGISRAQDNGLDPRPAIDGPAFENLAEIMTSVEYIAYDATVIPENFDLAQNYPNPFNPTTTIQFTLPMNSNVKLTVYNTLGQSVATLLSGDLNAGVHRIQWDASNLPSGMYIYRLEAGSTVLNKKLTLLK